MQNVVPGGLETIARWRSSPGRICAPLQTVGTGPTEGSAFDRACAPICPAPPGARTAMTTATKGTILGSTPLASRDRKITLWGYSFLEKGNPVDASPRGPGPSTATSDGHK